MFIGASQYARRCALESAALDHVNEELADLIRCPQPMRAGSQRRLQLFLSAPQFAKEFGQLGRPLFESDNGGKILTAGHELDEVLDRHLWELLLDVVYEVLHQLDGLVGNLVARLGLAAARSGHEREGDNEDDEESQHGLGG